VDPENSVLDECPVPTVRDALRTDDRVVSHAAAQCSDWPAADVKVSHRLAVRRRCGLLPNCFGYLLIFASIVGKTAAEHVCSF